MAAYNKISLPGAILYFLVFAATSGCVGSHSGPPPEAFALTAERLRQATYKGILDAPVTLVDGRYEGKPFVPGSATRPIVKLVPGVIATGDLDRDGIDEAVVVLAHSSGGSGVFMYLATVRDNGGKPENIATVRLGDRVKVLAVGIDDGRIVADLVQHGPNDPMCCPTSKVRRGWLLQDGELVGLESKAGPTGSRIRGHVVWGHESRSFTECGGKREGWVINESGDELVEVYEELTSVPYQPMFAEVRGEWVAPPQEGFGAEFGEALRITEFLRAENEGFGCRLDLNGVLFVASGNEPFWRLRIRDDGIAMQLMGSPEERVFDAPDRREQAGRITFESGSPDSGIRVVLERRRCVDSMSGARYAWAVTVDTDGRQLEGCAAEGL
jgi:uncharacterized membrane protein